MKQLFIVTLFILIKLSLFANRCDSLALAPQEQTGKLQIDALNEHSRCFINKDCGAMDSITQYTINRAKKMNYSIGLARAYQNAGIYQQYIVRDFLAMDIRQALYHAETITGEVSTDDLLGNIFANFCIGK
jgi:tRNA U34 5-carboxymethylaminomethyl modifying GTPase MnmE/TrmE